MISQPSFVVAEQLIAPADNKSQAHSCTAEALYKGGSMVRRLQQLHREMPFQQSRYDRVKRDWNHEGGGLTSWSVGLITP